MKSINRHTSLWYLLGGVILFTGCGSAEETTQPMRQDITETVFASGELDVDDAYSLVAQVEGYLSELRLQEGHHVRTGDVVAVIDNQINEVTAQNAQLQLAIAQQNAAVSGPALRQLAANLASAEQKLAFDSLQAIRYRRLATTEAVAGIEAEKSELAYQASRKARESLAEQYKSAQLAVNQQLIAQQNQAEVNQVMRQYNRVKAPVEGKIWQVFKEPGDYVRKGDVLARIGKTDRLYARLAVDEGSIAKVKVGQQVWIRLNTHPDTVSSGTVTEILPQFDTARQSYLVKVHWNTPPPLSIVGTQLEANIVIQQRSQVLVIPRRYIGYGQQVWKKGDDSPITIQTGFVSDEWVEVKKGVTASDVLILHKR